MPGRFIGCATDAKFVEPTAVMLSSVDINGNVPDASVLVAAFQLNEEHKKVIRIGAGKLSSKLRFIDIEDVMWADVARVYTDQYPPAVLGRLFIADYIVERSARLLTLDSDMIVNASIETLFDLDMEGEYFAAVHDFPRHHDSNYFNSGMTLSEVDTYKYYDVSRRCLKWLSEHPDSTMPDQDALNSIVGDCWYRLDYCWNRHLIEGRAMKLHDFESARIAHFADVKPWDNSGHAGLKLYNRYLSRLEGMVEAANQSTEIVVS
jgi:lipopolysaccharide biosynthesis glycosyltransferase